MASVENQFVFDASTQSEEWVDFDQFLDLEPSYSDDYSASANSISPDMTLSYDTDMFTNDLPDLTQSGFPEMDYGLSQEGLFADQSPSFESLDGPLPVFDDAMFPGYQTYDNTYDFRQMVEAQAASDPRVASIKEKRREAAIALHLQRLCDATALDLDMSSDSNTSFSSPCWSDYMRESISPQSATSSPEQASAALPSGSGTGGLEMVLDLNMNAAANLPKKQKPRSQAQKENYIKARKYGACEKHKKQHKRCNCLEKAAALAGVNEVPMDVTYKDRVKQPMPKLPQVPSPRTSSVPGPHILETQLGVRSSASVAKRNVPTSVNDSSARSTITRPDVQLFTKSATKLTRSSAGHDPQFSTSFVLSPNPDYSKRTNDSPGRAPSLNVSRTSTLETNRKKVGLPTYRGCSLGKSSANRPTDAFARPTDAFTRHVATMQAMVKQTISVASTAERRESGTHCASVQSPAIRRLGVTHAPVRSVSGDSFVKQTNPSGTNAQNRGLEVYHSRTSLLSSTAKSRSPVLTSHARIYTTENVRAEVNSWPQRVLGAIDRSVPQGLQQMLQSIAKSLDISLRDRCRYPVSLDNSNAACPASRDRHLRQGHVFLSAMSALVHVFSMYLGRFVLMATFWQLSSSRSSLPRRSDRLVAPSLSAFCSGSTFMSASERLGMFPLGKLMSCMVR
ncbi:hypothetical protein N7478_009677 [Penicillium angulare]|uniref:uncharacterized protein n=1 Tax=Penicillium angulare TaxID=116970 RepID=UPI0025407D48|nr:uncharacterized protein N7478_009677 [Penicillium angulare]KAJ5266869.1 hypothetical protein N7478_009677 [Penicillium angulare]